ncbi:MAG: AAA family ATPase [Acidobacteria bacterium]|nr:AAA family ATPase [Acidobacteriota bacterium]
MSMYREHFGLRVNPFTVNPDPRFLLLTPQMREALAVLTYGVQERKGFILLTGEVGTGKTTAINKLLEWLHLRQLPSAFVFNPRLTPLEFLQFMMADFGIHNPSPDKGMMLKRLNQWLVERYREHKTAVLIIDEAQNLSFEMLEEVRLLTNLETSTAKLLQVVLAGQPELERRLADPEMRQLRQRITLLARTTPLTQEQTASYIDQRLRIAGAATRLFDPAAVAAVHCYAQGIPRVTNVICEHALISAFADQKTSVDARLIEQVAEEFDLVPARTAESWEATHKRILVTKETR